MIWSDVAERPSERSVRVAIRRYRAATLAEATDEVAAEEPFEIRVAGRPIALIMRTPGADHFLTLGFLFAEGIIHAAADVREVAFARDRDGFPQGNVLELRLRSETEASERLGKRNFVTTSSCGLCGTASIEAAQLRLETNNDANPITAAVLLGLDATLRAAQAVFSRTGGLHAAGLFDGDGKLLAIHEDVGRHNAVDKVVGEMLLAERLPLVRTALLVSGRASFELVQKAALAGIPVLAAIGAPSSLAVELAEASGVTLVGMLRRGHFVVYSRPERVIASEVDTDQSLESASAHCSPAGRDVE
ncbi:MAG TPA: formate dehydrogenase accessory sulfurtransferase FdhD [Chloroflexota bacterium]|nr:formate dehydrogenase accessory sulfurtransferase FdhD [Chloroflexota bacterium]